MKDMIEPDHESKVLKGSYEDRYQMLIHLRNGCERFLGAGHRQLKCLYNNDIRSHINFMRQLYYSFDVSEKPDWIDLNLIKEYENRMLD